MAKTALIIVDMVRDFTDPEGLVFYPENQKILPRLFFYSTVTEKIK